MIDTSLDWPQARLLGRHLRTARSFTATLATWVDAPHIDIDLFNSLTLRGHHLDPSVAEQLQTRADTEISYREVHMRAHGIVVATAMSYIALARLTPQARSALAAGVNLGEALEARTRVPVLVALQQSAATGDHDATVLHSEARLDSIGGTPLAFCIEKVLEAAFIPATARIPATTAGA